MVMVTESRRCPAYIKNPLPLLSSPVLSHCRWGRLSWILPSYLDADEMAAQVVPYKSTVTVDKRRVGERKLK